jgi:hypothetical protein
MDLLAFALIFERALTLRGVREVREVSQISIEHAAQPRCRDNSSGHSWSRDEFSQVFNSQN